MFFPKLLNIVTGNPTVLQYSPYVTGFSEQRFMHFVWYKFKSQVDVNGHIRT